MRTVRAVFATLLAALLACTGARAPATVPTVAEAPTAPTTTSEQATERITLVVLDPDGTRDKFMLSSWVGIPRKGELLWLGDDPYLVLEIEYAVAEGDAAAKAIDAVGLYVRRLTKDEQEEIARHLAPASGQKETP